MSANPLPSIVPVLGRLLCAVVLAAVAAPPAQAQSDWVPCADEGALCRIHGDGLVRFGVDGRYAFRVVHNRVVCDTDEFGDPAPNSLKQCQVSYDWRRDERYRNWREPGSDAGDRWRQCANEGDTCRPPGPARVRYGANGRYAFRETSAPIVCNNSVFGDPAPDVAKQCDYSTEAGDGSAQGRPGSLAWDACAWEGSRCNVRSATIVRYGRPGLYFYREVSDSLVCSNDSFGGDPAPSERKSCERLRLLR